MLVNSTPAPLEPGASVREVLDVLCPEGAGGTNNFHVIGIPGILVIGYHVAFPTLDGKVYRKTRVNFSFLSRWMPTISTVSILLAPMLGVADWSLKGTPDGAVITGWVFFWAIAGFAGGWLHMKKDFEERIEGVFTAAAEAKATRSEMVGSAVELLWVVYYLRPFLANWRSLFSLANTFLFGWVPFIGRSVREYVGIDSMRGWVEPSLFAAIRTITRITNDEEAQNISAQSVWDGQIKLALKRFRDHKWAWVRFIILQWLFCGLAAVGALIAAILIFLQNGGGRYLP